MVQYSCGRGGAAAPRTSAYARRPPVEAARRFRKPLEARTNPWQRRGRSGFVALKGALQMSHRTVASITADMEALLDRAQAERRNLTPAEEERYVKLARLRAMLEDLEGVDSHESRTA